VTERRRARISSATSHDVARAANVSQALVSRAFSGVGRIAPATRERIFKVAAELGWRPNALAASVVTGDAPLVAIITTMLNLDWRALVLSHLLHSFEGTGLKPILFYADSDGEVDRLLAETVSWRTRGVIVTAGMVPRERAEAIVSRGQFLAALNRPGNHPVGFSIATDNPLGGAQAAGVLLAEGRQCFLALAGPPDSWASAERAEGFVTALRETGRDATIWHNADMSVDAGKLCAERYLALPPGERPDAVFSTNDAMAIGFVDGLRGQGVAIPEQLSLIGFDNLTASGWAPYRLTTFEQPLDLIVEGVMGHVIAHQQQGDGTHPAEPPRPVHNNNLVRVAPRLVVRGTTRAAIA
jgi:DNA-binding LacI/PurR family transcriptional regulator